MISLGKVRPLGKRVRFPLRLHRGQIFFTGKRITLQKLRFLESDFGGGDSGGLCERMISLGKVRPLETGPDFLYAYIEARFV